MSMTAISEHYIFALSSTCSITYNLLMKISFSFVPMFLLILAAPDSQYGQRNYLNTSLYIWISTYKKNLLSNMNYMWYQNYVWIHTKYTEDTQHWHIAPTHYAHMHFIKDNRMTHLPNVSFTKHQQNVNTSITLTGRVHVGTGSSFTKCG